jgi:hypothetical protein
MSEASLAVQKVLLTRLRAYAPLMALVPSASIFDRNSRPEVFPSIVIGEAQIVDEDLDLARTYVRVYTKLHIWTREDGMRQVKEITGAMRKAIRIARNRAPRDGDFSCADIAIENTEFMRDPDGATSHGVMTINTLVNEHWVKEMGAL